MANNLRSTAENVAENLRYLCAQQKSVSAVCRQLKINRQQFSRYLNGSNRPSFYNLTRICHYFSISVDSIFLPGEKFRELNRQLPHDFDQLHLPAPISRELSAIASVAMPELDAYVGYFYHYMFAFGFHGFVFKSLIVVRKIGPHYCTKHIERISKSNAPTGIPLIFKYNGILNYFAGRLFLNEREAYVHGALSQSVYAPIFRPGNRILTGVACSIASTTANNPTAARTVLEFLGKEIDMKIALKECGLFMPTDKAIAPYILSMIENKNKSSDFTLKSHRG